MSQLFCLTAILLLISGCSGTTVKLESPDKPINVHVTVDVEDHVTKPMSVK